jgi:hypothetical protein
LNESARIAQLARLACRHPLRVVAVSDPARGRDERGDGPGDPGRDREAHDRGRDDRDDRGRGEGPAHRFGEGRVGRLGHGFAHLVTRRVAHRLGEVARAHQQDRHGDGADRGGDHDQERHENPGPQRTRQHQVCSRRR